MSGNKRVLLTGASGFIGSNVLRHLLEQTNWTFTCISSWRHRGNPLRIPKDERVEVVTHDLVGEIPDLGDFDYILHLASESHVDRSIAHPVEFIENNVSSTLQVLEYARRHTPEVFVMFSTDEVYGAAEHDEWDVLLPSNPYSASKAAQEMVSIAYFHTYKLPIVITNSNNIVGPGQDREKFLPKLVHAISRGESVTLHTSGGRFGRRYYNPVRNVADALLFILDSAHTGVLQARHLDGTVSALAVVGDRPLRFNIPGGTELNNLELATKVAEVLDDAPPLRYTVVDVNTVRPAYDEFYPHTDGLLNRMGWTPPAILRDELPDIVRSYLA